eukprot:927707-Pleurochrysis_carterae.AAC.1
MTGMVWAWPSIHTAASIFGEKIEMPFSGSANLGTACAQATEFRSRYWAKSSDRSCVAWRAEGGADACECRSWQRCHCATAR